MIRFGGDSAAPPASRILTVAAVPALHSSVAASIARSDAASPDSSASETPEASGEVVMRQALITVALTKIVAEARPAIAIGGRRTEHTVATHKMFANRDTAHCEGIGPASGSSLFHRAPRMPCAVVASAGFASHYIAGSSDVSHRRGEDAGS